MSCFTSRTPHTGRTQVAHRLRSQTVSPVSSTFLSKEVLLEDKTSRCVACSVVMFQLSLSQQAFFVSQRTLVASSAVMFDLSEVVLLCLE